MNEYIKRDVTPRHRQSYKRTSEYATWVSMKQRCYNQNHSSYRNYGGRGIRVCARWYVFENFLSDMGSKPKDLSLDRINNDGHYMPSNCKWSTRDEQQMNRRGPKLTKERVLEIREASGRQEEIAAKFGVSRRMISYIKRGDLWSHV